LEYLIPASDLNTLFPPNQSDESCESTVGIQPANIAIQYGSDDLMNLYCQDLANGAGHADGQVGQLMQWYYPIATLEAMGLWTTLANKQAGTNWCATH
jgi:hypothetical protein